MSTKWRVVGLSMSIAFGLAGGAGGCGAGSGRGFDSDAAEGGTERSI